MAVPFANFAYFESMLPKGMCSSLMNSPNETALILVSSENATLSHGKMIPNLGLCNCTAASLEKIFNRLRCMQHDISKSDDRFKPYVNRNRAIKFVYYCVPIRY